MSLIIDIADEQSIHAIDHARLKRAVRSVLEAAGIRAAEISIAIVDDARMHALNRQYLAHDYPTDVLSFVWDRDESVFSLDGEIIVSADYAAREATRYEWTTDDELLLYVIHGSLHLVGHDDKTPEGQAAMRAAEAKHLAQFGLTHRYDDR
ncbi:MAG: rRNA maturation RNase YbeY [Planctomycetaceae bacterium]|nr:rRNA maturation RNase YbeY [Planctomycetaceae bacterium]